MIQQLREIWRFRELLKELFFTWLKLRHTGSILGLVWTLVNPAIFILTYWVVFTYVIRIDLPRYATFLIPGYLAWSFTWTAISGASESMTQSSYLITKVAFPSEILVLASVGIALFDYIAGLLLYICFAALIGVPFLLTAALLPIIIVLHLLFVLGLAFIGASGSVFFRDIPKLITVAGFLLFFATPIFYPESLIPSSLQAIYQLNPFAPFISLYHHALYFGTMPSIGTILEASLLAIALIILGMLTFRHFKASFAEFA